MENQNEELGTSDQEEAVDLETTEEQQTEETQENVEVEKLKQIAENQKIRAEKAERELKKFSKETKSETQSDSLSQKDLIAIMNAKVGEDDIDEVIDYAKLKKISVSEALKSSLIKSLLGEKEEQRKVAKATNTGNSRRGSSQVSEEALYNEAMKGNVPDNQEDMKRLIRYRLKINK